MKTSQINYRRCHFNSVENIQYVKKNNFGRFFYVTGLKSLKVITFPCLFLMVSLRLWL